MKYLFQSFGDMSEAEHRLANFASPEAQQLASESPDADGNFTIESVDAEDSKQEGDKKFPEARKSAADNPEKAEKEKLDQVAADIKNTNAKVEGYIKNFQKATDTKVDDWQGKELKSANENLNKDENKALLKNFNDLLDKEGFTPEEKQQAIGVTIAMMRDPALRDNDTFKEQFPVAQKIIDKNINLTDKEKQFFEEIGASLDAVQAELEAKPEKGNLSLKAKNDLADPVKAELAKITPEELDNMTDEQINQKIGDIMSKTGVLVTLNKEKNGFDVTPPTNGLGLLMNRLQGYMTFFGSMIEGLKPKKDGEKPKTNGEKRTDDYTSRLKALNDSKDNTQASIGTEVKDGKVNVTISSKSGNFSAETLKALTDIGAKPQLDGSVKMDDIKADQIKTLEGLTSVFGEPDKREGLRNNIPENETPEAKSHREGLIKLLEAGATPTPTAQDLSSDTSVYSISTNEGEKNPLQIKFTDGKWQMKVNDGQGWINANVYPQTSIDASPLNSVGQSKVKVNELIVQFKELNKSSEKQTEGNQTLKEEKKELTKNYKEKIQDKVTLLKDKSVDGYVMLPSSDAKLAELDTAIKAKIDAVTTKEDGGKTVVDTKEVDDLMKDAGEIINKELGRIVKEEGQKYIESLGASSSSLEGFSWIDLTGIDDMNVKFDKNENHWVYKEQDANVFTDPSKTSFTWPDFSDSWIPYNGSAESEARHIADELKRINSILDDNKS